MSIDDYVKLKEQIIYTLDKLYFENITHQISNNIFLEHTENEVIIHIYLV